MEDKEKTYKEIHGETRVGKFLRSIGKGDIIGKVVGSAASLAKGDILGALKTLLASEKTLTTEERSHALDMVRLDIEKEKSISSRWNSDLRYGNMLTKSIRPLVLIFLTVSFIVGWFLEYELKEISSLLTVVLTAYFGGRSFEKVMSTR